VTVGGERLWDKARRDGAFPTEKAILDQLASR